MTAVDFRCEQCGKLLSVEALPGQDVKCPHCQKKVQVPAALASLPRPQVPGMDGQASAGTTAPSEVPPQVEGELEPVGAGAAVGTVAAMLPWVMSLFLHLGVGLILSFAGMMYVTSKTVSVDDILIPGENFTKTPGGVIHPGSMSVSKEAAAARTEVSTGVKSTGASIITSSSGQSGGLMQTMGGEGTAGGGMARMGGMGGMGRGPKAKFFGTGGGGGNIHHVVFLIDRSGSMELDYVLRTVKLQMRVSIRNLSEEQDFHIIFFGDKGAAKELETRRLIPATEANKLKASEFLDTIDGRGATDPMPALKRAVAVLKEANKNSGKQIFLLTDADEKLDADVKEVLDYVKDNCKDIFINTYIFKGHGDVGPTTSRMLQEISRITGGQFKTVGGD